MIAATLTVLFAALLAQTLATPLDDYVWTPDKNYGWVDMGEEHILQGKGYVGYTLNLTSQRWLTDADFSPDSQSKSIWWHYLVVIVPDNVQYTKNGTLYITGGSQGSGFPSTSDEDIQLTAALATATGLISATLFQIPNEHTTFSSDPIQKSRTEDAIIAFTWDHFLKNPDQPEWLLRFPMVKASLRAMDAMTEFVSQKFPTVNSLPNAANQPVVQRLKELQEVDKATESDEKISMDYYTVAGASKRGWTTWDVGAVDTTGRVQAIAPIVLDAINFVDVEHHQYRSYGGWTYALEDYTDLNLTMRFDEPNMKTLQEYVDPFFYKERLTLPKLVVNAGMDEFQQPDDTHYWWDQMPEPKHFMLIPNAEHSLATGIFEAVPAIGAWIQAILNKDAVPTFTWEISETTGEIVATLDDTGIVHSATVWYSNSCGENNFDNQKKRRDFRVAHLDNPCSCGLFAEGYCLNFKTLWQKQELVMERNEEGKRTYRAQLDAPEDGSWVGFFIDIKYVNKHARKQIASQPLVIDETKDEDQKSRRLTLKARQLLLENWREQMKKTEGDDFEFGGFPTDFGRFMEFTTEISVWPNTFPYEDCVGEACGTLLL